MEIFIFGNGNLTWEEFGRLYLPELRKLSSSGDHAFLLCDFRGTDTLCMEFLKTVSSRVSLFHIGERPRYLPDKYRTKVSQWTLRGGFVSDEERDSAALQACTHFLAYDFNTNEKRKSGTLKNIEMAIEMGKIRLGE